MTFSKTLICLANSRRNQNHCVAGKEWADAGPGQWIRPIHSEVHQEITTAEQAYEGGGCPTPGDLFRLTFERPYPDGNQTENHIIDQSEKWEAVRQASWAEIESCIDAGMDTIWTVGDSSAQGENDKILAKDRQSIRSSLMLVRPENFVLHVAKEYNPYDGKEKWKNRADFEFGNRQYRFVVTDTVMWSKYVERWEEADYELRDVIVCISMMGTNIDTDTTKLVAAVLERKNFE